MEDDFFFAGFFFVDFFPEDFFFELFFADFFTEDFFADFFAGFFALAFGDLLDRFLAEADFFRTGPEERDEPSSPDPPPDLEVVDPDEMGSNSDSLPDGTSASSSSSSSS